MKDKIANIIIGLSVTAAIIGACMLVIAGIVLLISFPVQCGIGAALYIVFTGKNQNNNMNKKLFFRITFIMAFAAGGFAVPRTAVSIVVYLILCIVVGVLIKKINKFIYG